jgi:cellulose synthase/poly-beta-1,6-N-acetylglucosamine synthase-like glycosyltransferase
LIFAYFILFGYGFVLLYLAYGFIRTKNYSLKQVNQHSHVSIIICARNEEKNIGKCIESVASQDYPKEKIDLIFVDDASTDHTLAIAKLLLTKYKFNYQVIKNPVQCGKKVNLSKAIELAKFELIITRDADTFTLSKNWLSSITQFQNDTKSDLIIAPIALQNKIGLFWALQAIENNILSVLTCGSSYFNKPFLANGANLAFTKNIFKKTKGYQSHINTASGDDVLFLEDVKKISGSLIKYIKSKDAIVYTYPTYCFKELIHQKIRWAGKFKVNKNILNLVLALLSFGVNLTWLLYFILYLFNPKVYENSFHFILIKLLLDFLILLVASSFIKNKSLQWYSLPVGLIYPLYACTVALAAVFVKPKWKN